MRYKKLIWFFCAILVGQARGYFEPLLPLGTTHILDGTRWRVPGGWYGSAYLQEYYAHTFTGPDGNALTENGKSPKLFATALVPQILYQTHKQILFKAWGGVSITLPIVLSLKLTANDIFVFDDVRLDTSGNGFGDLNLSAYLQWPIYKINQRPLFGHRLALNVSVPSGKAPVGAFLSPGNGFAYLNPNWAMTLYLTEHWALSSRFNYVWNAPNSKTKTQAGQAFFINFDLAYQTTDTWWLAATGYYLKEFTDDIIAGTAHSDTREEVAACGFGALYSSSERFFLLTYLNFEVLAQNRSKGINFVLRGIVYF